MKIVAIAGVGLIGGSFGLALRKAGFTGEILGVSSPAAIETGVKIGAISRGVTLNEAAAQADLIYLAQPVDRILQTLETLGRMMPAECLITDAGSTKAAIVGRAAEYLPHTTFLGGHPLAGKEQRGANAADPELFRGRPYVLTPNGSMPAAAEEFRSWLERIGANVIEMRPADHDVVVAFTSHLPQLLSTALARTLAAQHNARLTQVSGPGLLDMTRLALSSPDLWLSILATNRAEVITALEAFMESLQELRNTLGSEGIVPLFDTAAEFARNIRNPAFRKP